ncbi:MAG: N-6 DNA methylase [Comamonas sp.]|nr:N-6 DNA methylase [Comamonas sp.]
MLIPTKKAADKPDNASAGLAIVLVGEDEYIFCPVREKAYKVNNKPEEKVRFWWLYRLKNDYGYPFDQLAVEVPVKVGSTEAKKKADIVVYTDASHKTPRIFIEVKKPNRKDGVDQLKVYMNATGCRLGVWSNGAPPHSYLLRIEPTETREEADWRELRNIPRRTENLDDVDSPITRKELAPVTDFLDILRECEDYIKAHEGVSPFEELFKLIFAKLYDERANLKNDDSPAKFRVGVFESPELARRRIDNDLFEPAKKRWSGVFKEGDEIQLSDQTLAFCVSALQKTYLLKSDSDVLGSAFEVMINPGMKGDKGQYFTPRHVIQMCIDVLDPNEHQTIYDPACGSGGFLIAAMDKVFKKIEDGRDDRSEILENQKDYASQNVFGMDYDHTIAKVAKAYMLIWGDGRSNIAVSDGLNEDSWTDDALSKFTHGTGKARRLRKFDLIATNPPFAGDHAAEETIAKYDLSIRQSAKGPVRAQKVARDKLFVERCIKMLAPLGRMAIVLPRGTLKNYSDENVRRYILKYTRVVAVVGLGGEMFKPFTNTKTCVLFLQKRPEPLTSVDEAKDDPKVVYAVTERPGKDKSGRLIRGKDGNIISDLPDIAAYIKKKATFLKA